MAEKTYTATGYGATSFEARNNAENQINTAISIDEGVESAFGFTGTILLVLLGYACLAFALARSFFFRPLPALIVATALGGAGYVWMAAAASSFEGEGAFFAVVFYFIIGSPFAFLISRYVPRTVMAIERLEASILRCLPATLRVPVTIAILLSPLVAFAVWISWLSADWTTTSLVYAAKRTFTDSYWFAGWFVTASTVAAILARAWVHPLAYEFNWWGGRLPDPQPTLAVAKTSEPAPES